jgi:hypothetical protein
MIHRVSKATTSIILWATSLIALGLLPPKNVHAMEYNTQWDFTLDRLRDGAELVIVAYPIQIDPYSTEVEVFRLAVTEVIKGTLDPEMLLQVKTGIMSTMGVPPRLGSKGRYLFFLEKEPAPDTPTPRPVYKIIGLWQGAIALSADASATKAADYIKKRYGISPITSADTLLAALRFSMNAPACELYDVLGLGRHATRVP